MSLLTKTALKQYYTPNACPICQHPIKGHARAQCSNCHRIVCQRHMVPYLGPNKMCPDCRERQKQFVQPAPPQPASMAQPQAVMLAQSPIAPMMQSMAAVEELYNTDRVAEARALTDSVFVDVFGRD